MEVFATKIWSLKSYMIIRKEATEVNKVFAMYTALYVSIKTAMSSKYCPGLDL